MSADNWRELLDDVEVRKIVETVDATSLRWSDPYLQDDRLSYLWDCAIDVAIKYEDSSEARDPHAYWCGYLWAALNRAARWQAIRTYAPGCTVETGSERIQAQLGRDSTDRLYEEFGDTAFTPNVADETDVIDIGTDVPMLAKGDPDAPGAVRIRKSDPLYQVLLLERLERLVHRIESDGPPAQPVWTSDTGTRLCSDVTCWRPARRAGMCSTHYNRHREQWGSPTATTCNAEGCTALGSLARGFCSKHYAEYRRNDPSAPRCLDCGRAAVENDRCTYHARVARKRAREAANT